MFALMGVDHCSLRELRAGLGVTTLESMSSVGGTGSEQRVTWCRLFSVTVDLGELLNLHILSSVVHPGRGPQRKAAPETGVAHTGATRGPPGPGA